MKVFNKLTQALSRFSFTKSSAPKLLCRSEELGVSVYKSGEEYTLQWDEYESIKKYEITSYASGEDLFYIQAHDDSFVRCWIKIDGNVVFFDRYKTLENSGVNELSQQVWGEDLAHQVWDKSQLQTRGNWKALVTHHHRDYCGQGLFILTQEEAIKLGLQEAGIGIFTVEDSFPSQPIFYWSDKRSFIDDFKRITDWSMSGADNSDFYAAISKSTFHLNNQILTKSRIEEWLSS